MRIVVDLNRCLGLRNAFLWRRTFYLLAISHCAEIAVCDCVIDGS